MTAFNFDDYTIREIFGTDTAEDETPERLKAYFFKNRAYDNIRANLPIRILVGHKGIGKSALLRMSFLEDRDLDILSLWLQPSDLIIDSRASQSFVEKIESYKQLINRRIYYSSLDRLKLAESGDDKFNFHSTAKHLVGALYAKLVAASGADVDAETQRMRS
ncbi:MAG: hypothetical protein OXC11_02665, partial [Rhodospirillales bacterium]|nr:hypothetical protein [Rhodospirillales bacterium]